MATENHIRNPFEMALQGVSDTVSDLGRTMAAPTRHHAGDGPVAVRRIGLDDLRAALREGLADLGASRTDVVFLCLFYPLAGLALARLAFNQNLLPLIFPLLSGFALVGPLAAVGLYEISRRREAGAEASWRDAFAVFRSPALGTVLGLGSVIVLLFAAWLAAAWGIWTITLGPQPPASAAAFISQVFGTPAGWAMIVLGFAVGFLFAVAALALSAFSFPLALDHDVGVGKALSTSVRAVAANPVTMAAWGLIVAAALALGSIPALVGLMFVMPVLGHATWRLYRRTIGPE